MDLSVSPDIEAYFCYILVLSLGAITAIVQINRVLGDLSGVWLIPRTWLLFLMYLSVPIGLFWFLDRTGAITDTSFFAAVLIGVGYERIMNGTSQAIPGTAGLLQFWTPFQTYANEVQKSVLQRTKQNEDRLLDSLVTSIIANEDKGRYAALEQIAFRFSQDAVALRTRLAAVDAANAVKSSAARDAPHAEAPPKETGPDAAATSKEALEDKTRLLFTELVRVPDIFFLMKKRGVISNAVYWWDVRSIRRLVSYLVALVPLAIILAYVGQSATVRLGQLPSAYYVWRLTKTNSSSIERDRARPGLLALMRDNSATRETATRAMTTALHQPGLPVERIDLLLQSLLESRSSPSGNDDLATQLVASLRAASVDARTRINDVLKHLADTTCAVKFDENDKVWKPSDGDATVSLEARIKTWSDYWNMCVKKTTG